MKILKNNTPLLICYAILITLILAACKSNSKTDTNEKNADATDSAKTEATQKNLTTDSTKLAFNIDDLPITTKDIGIFPYLKAPEQYKYNDISRSDLATVHFAVNGELFAVEGKTYSTNIYKLQESETPFNTQIVQKAYDQTIKDLGGVKVSSKLLPGQIEKVGEKLLQNEGDHAYTIIGANDFTLSHINTYVIRTAKATVWIELSFYQNGGYIYILEKAN